MKTSKIDKLCIKIQEKGVSMAFRRNEYAMNR